MKAVLYILFGWTLTTATAWALGSFLLRRMRLRLYRSEEVFLGFIAGVPCLSAFIFALCALHLVHKGIFLGIAIAAFILAAKTPGCPPPEAPLSPVPRLWKWAFGIVFASFTVLYFINAFAPETSPDGAAYHIPIAAHYYRAHGFERVTWNMYFNLSQGIELLFLMAFAFGRDSAAALTHFSFLLVLPFLMITYARRFGFAPAGIAAALIVFVSPVIGMDGSSAYIDVALTAIVFGMYYFLQLWHSDRSWRFLIPAALLAGFSFATKYTAITAVAYAVLFVAWSAWRRKLPILRNVALVASLSFLMMAPWLVKNWFFVNNPIAPFANSLFPNQYFHISAEQNYRDYLRKYELTSYREIPLELTIRGEKLAGFYGPLFLLAPLALLGLRNPVVRHLLLAAVVLGSTYFLNIGSRLLMPVIPFLSLGLALVLQRFRWILFGLTLGQAILCWPWIAKMYCSQYAWRLDNLPVSAAFRIEPEDHYIARTLPGYLASRLLDQYMDPSDKVFCFSDLPEAYTSRHVLVPNGAQNQVLYDILMTAMIRDYQPRKTVEFDFAEQAIRRIRVVQTARLPNDEWYVSEFRAFTQGREVPRDPHWRLRAHPNPWDVQLAFDNAQVTRWRSWEPAMPGMFIEIDFGAPLTIDSARIETSDNETIQLRVEGMNASGRWVVLNDHPRWTIHPLTRDLRRSATAELRKRGVNFVVVDSSNYRADDFFRYSANWGLKELARRGTYRLYYIEELSR